MIHSSKKKLIELVENSNLPKSEKEKLKKMLNDPDPKSDGPKKAFKKIVKYALLYLAKELLE